MSNSIWHDKNEKPVKVLHKNYIIITKWGSVLGESDVDSGYTIETDWAYLTDIIVQADKAERLQEIAERQNDILQDNFATLGYSIGKEVMDMSDEIKQLIKGE